MPQDVSNINVITMLQRRIWGRGTGNAGEWEAITRGTQGKRLKNRSLQTCSCCVSNAILELQSLQSLQIKPSFQTCSFCVSNATLGLQSLQSLQIKPSFQTCSCCVSNATLGLQSLQSLQIKPSVKTCDCWAVSNATLKSHNGEGKGEIKPKLAYWDYLAC